MSRHVGDTTNNSAHRLRVSLDRKRASLSSSAIEASYDSHRDLADALDPPTGVPPVPKSHGIQLSVSWRRLVELARQIHAKRDATGHLDAALVAKLAHSALLFQAQLLGRFSGGRHPS